MNFPRSASKGFLPGGFGVQNDTFENLAQHLRINGNFLRKRRVFADSEIVSFKEIIKKRGEGFVADTEFGLQRTKFVVIKQATIQERNTCKAIAKIGFGQTAEEPVEELLVISKSLKVFAERSEVLHQVLSLLIEPAAILSEVEEYEAFNEQLRLSEGFFGVEVRLIVSEIGFNVADVAVEFFEEFVGERLLVEGFVAKVAQSQSAECGILVEIELCQTFGGGSVSFTRPDAKTADHHARGSVLFRAASDFGMDKVNPRAAFAVETSGVGKAIRVRDCGWWP